MIFNLLQASPVSAEQIAKEHEAVIAHVEELTSGLITDPVSTINALMQDAVEFGFKVIVSLIIYVVGAWLIRIIKRRMRASFARRNADKAMASFTTSFVTIFLSVLLIVVTAGTLGINTTSIAALLAAGGMAIGMAMSGTVQNFAGGIMILSFKPFKSGDLITAQGHTGVVHEISIVNTSMETADGHTVIIPNGTLFNGTIDNFTRRGVRRVEWTLGLEYGTDAESAIKSIRAILESDSRILNANAEGATDPTVVVGQLGSSSVDFLVRAWVVDADFWPVFYDMNLRFYSILQEQGFSFPFPQMDVRVSKLPE